MIGEIIFAGTSARCQQAYNWRDNIILIIGVQSASWWSVNIHYIIYIYCWPTIGAPIIVPPILARSSAVSFNSVNPTWVVWQMSKIFISTIIMPKSYLQIGKKMSPTNPLIHLERFHLFFRIHRNFLHFFYLSLKIFSKFWKINVMFRILNMFL